MLTEKPGETEKPQNLPIHKNRREFLYKYVYHRYISIKYITSA